MAGSPLLPDALILDIGAKPPQFWIIEAVATEERSTMPAKQLYVLITAREDARALPIRRAAPAAAR